MTTFGQIKKLKVKELWPHEEHDFTPWLAENINVLGEVLGADLECISREASVGSYYLDILAKDLSTNRYVVIENQFNLTNHDHLGKIITYASGYKASMIIWIFETIKEEHRQAIEWLNEISSKDIGFFAIQIEAIQIDDSKPAYILKPIVYPNEWGKEPPDTKKNSSEKMEKYKAFYQKVIDVLNNSYKFTNAKKSQPQNWYTFASGTAGISYSLSFNKNNKFRAELYIGIGKDKTIELFNKLKSQKEEIESKLSPYEVIFDNSEDKVTRNIFIVRDGSIDDNDQTLEEIQVWAIDYMLKFKKVFGPLIKRYA